MSLATLAAPEPPFAFPEPFFCPGRLSERKGPRKPGRLGHSLFAPFFTERQGSLYFLRH